MKSAFSKISGAMAAWVVGITLIAAQLAGAEASETQPQLNRTDLAPAALRHAAELIEKYVQPVAEQEPTPEQKRAIESAMQLLKSEQAMKGQSAIARFIAIGPAALGELRRLAATAPAENLTGEELTADTYAATMAPIIIRRVEAAQRQPLLDELLSLGDDARAVLALKLNENEAQATEAEARIETTTEALIKASANATLDAPAAARERKALAEAQATEKQVEARRLLLIELRGLLALKPPAPAQPPAPSAAQPQPATPPADVLPDSTDCPADRLAAARPAAAARRAAATRPAFVLLHSAAEHGAERFGLAVGQRRMVFRAAVDLRSAGHHGRAAKLQPDAATETLIHWAQYTAIHPHFLETHFCQFDSPRSRICLSEWQQQPNHSNA